MFHFYKSWKRKKTRGFLMFSGGIEMKHWAKMGMFSGTLQQLLQVEH